MYNWRRGTIIIVLWENRVYGQWTNIKWGRLRVWNNETWYVFLSLDLHDWYLDSSLGGLKTK